jgi:hypothetical protein
MARPGLEPGTPRFSVVLPLRLNLRIFPILQGISRVLRIARASGFSRILRPFGGRYGRRRASSAFSLWRPAHVSLGRRSWRARRWRRRAGRRRAARRAGGRAMRVPGVRRPQGRRRAARRTAGRGLVGAGDLDLEAGERVGVEALVCGDERDGCAGEGECAHVLVVGVLVSVARSMGCSSGGVTRPSGNASRR